MLELKQIFDNPGESTDISCQLDFSDCELFNSHPFITPVCVTGKITNTAGVVELTYAVRFTLALSCDRCLKDFEREFEYSFCETLVTDEVTEHDDYVVVPELKLSLEELCLSDILLSLPSKLVCNEDCKGLCPKCGANLNETECLCSNKEVDPRLAVLGELLKD